MKRKNETFDIMADAFQKSNKKFDEAVSKLKKMGYGYQEHYPEINPQGMWLFFLLVQVVKYNQ